MLVRHGRDGCSLCAEMKHAEKTPSGLAANAEDETRNNESMKPHVVAESGRSTSQHWDLASRVGTPPGAEMKMGEPIAMPSNALRHWTQQKPWEALSGCRPRPPPPPVTSLDCFLQSIPARSAD